MGRVKTTFMISASASRLFIFVVVVILLATAACSSACTVPQAASEIPEIAATPTGVWSGVLQQTPYPYATPLPPAQATILDGTYTRFDPREGERAPCRRCPAYPPEGGTWMFHLDKGVFRVFHEITGWHTLGSFTVSGDRVEFFNDPHCIDAVGIYTWKLEAGQLVLEVVEDECAFGLRTKNFTHLPWMSCQPPSTEAAVTGHWPIPPGCRSSRFDL